MKINLKMIKIKIKLNKVFKINNLQINLIKKVIKKIKRVILFKKKIEIPKNSRLYRKATNLKQSPLQLLYKSNHKRPIKNQNNLQSLMQVLL